MGREEVSAPLRPGGAAARGGGRSLVSVARRLARPVGVLVLAVSAVSYLAAVDPNEAGHYPTCPFLALTGYQCPGCGALRTVHALAHGQVREALGLNVLAVVMIPVLAFFWARWTVAGALGRPVRTKVAGPGLIWGFLAVVLLYWLVRNLPFGAFLAA